MGNFIDAGLIADSLTEDGRLLNKITALIQQQLKELVYEIDKNDRSKKQNIFEVTLSNAEKAALVLPALVGFILHAPVYFLLKNLIKKRVAPLGHFDSVIVGLTLVFYPVYILCWALIAQYYLGTYWGIITLFALPVTAWCCVRLNQQID
jgi:1-acyl-sn-glycerol-3-phosphate acyltransferase